MAETFSADTTAVVQARPDPSSGAMQAGGAVGTSFSGSGAVAPRVDPTADILLRLGSEILAPKIAEEQQRQFMEGVGQAAAGEALTDIIEKRPWYTEIFGPSAAVQGARAYSKNVALAEFGADMENRMPLLAEQPPEVIRKEALTAMQKQLTGDPVTDSLIQAAAAEQFAPIFKRHAREHYQFNQKQTKQSQLQFWTASAAAYQKIASDPDATPEERRNAGWSFLGGLGPFGDQTKESHANNISLMLQSAASDGNFHAINFFKQEKGADGKTLWDKLPEDSQTKLNAALPQYARKALDKELMKPNRALELNLILQDTLQDPRKAAQRMADFNAKVAKETGIQDAPMITGQMFSSTLSHILNAQASEAARLASKQQDNRQAQADSQAFTPGALILGEVSGAWERNHSDQTMLKAYLASPDAATRARLMIAQPGLKSKGIQEVINVQLTTDEYNKNIGEVAEVYKRLSATGVPEGTRTGYFDANAQKFFDRFNSSVAAGMPPQNAFVAAKVWAPLGKTAINAEDKGLVEKTIRSVAKDMNSSWFGKTDMGQDKDLNPAGLRIVQSVMARDLNDLRGASTLESASARAMQMAITDRGLQVYGEWAILAEPGNNQKPLHLLAERGPEETNNAFTRLMHSKAKLQDAKLDDYYIYRAPDQHGKAHFIVTANTKEGFVKTWTIGQDEIVNEIKVKPATALLPEQRLIARRDRPKAYYIPPDNE